MSSFEVENLDETLDKTLEECFEQIEEKKNTQIVDDDTNEEEVNDGGFDDDNEEYENVIELTFEQLVEGISEKYFEFLNKVDNIFKNHDSLSKSIKHDINYLGEKYKTNPYAVLVTITDNYLYCLEQIKDKNIDFFKYQKDKIMKKKGGSKGSVKVIKNKITKIGNKTVLKDILSNIKPETSKELFNEIIEIFKLLIYEDENIYNFHDDYLEFVKENFDTNKNYNKIMMVIENIDSIMGNLEDDELEEKEYEEKMKSEKESDSKKKKSKKKDGNVGEEFIKGIEDTKIAQMAKNISEKINLDDFPILTDPSKLLSTLTNPEEGLGSIGGLMDVVMKEVKASFEQTNSNENDLINEAQNIMGKLSGTNLDPVNLMKNMNIDMEKMGELFNKK
tara:strand:+ start:8032 stop:9204 length:1173 start_codon:yes stop_codon:yes gene_type:complete